MMMADEMLASILEALLEVKRKTSPETKWEMKAKTYFLKIHALI